MKCEIPQDVPHNAHNAGEGAGAVNSVHCVRGLGRIENLLAELRGVGVLLSVGADGLLAFDAPAGVLTEELRGRMRADREGLLAGARGARH